MTETKGTVGTPALLRSYSGDYVAWIEDTAQAIDDGRFREVDRAALADEVRGLGKTERRELGSALEVLLMYMLKTRYQPERQTRSWGLIMQVQRNHIAEFVNDSPSLRPELPALIATAHGSARLKTADETGLDGAVFPEACEWTVAEVLTPA